MLLLRVAGSLVFLAVMAGCEGCSDEAQQGGSTATGSERGTTGEETTGEGIAIDPGPAPTLRLVVEPAFGGAANLIVENRGDGAVELASALVLERQRDDDAFEPVEEIEGLALRFDCETPTPDCLTLVPGAALHPPPWSGDIGDAQCDCERCVDAPAGTYRFVVTTCGGGHRVDSPAFER